VIPVNERSGEQRERLLSRLFACISERRRWRPPCSLSLAMTYRAYLSYVLFSLFLIRLADLIKFNYPAPVRRAGTRRYEDDTSGECLIAESRQLTFTRRSSLSETNVYLLFARYNARDRGRPTLARRRACLRCSLRKGVSRVSRNNFTRLQRLNDTASDCPASESRHPAAPLGGVIKRATDWRGDEPIERWRRLDTQTLEFP